MKKLTVIAAGLGWDMLERRNAVKIGDMEFKPSASAFPAVTCVAQANMRTGATPLEHGILANGVWMDELRKPLFWEQSSHIVKGERVWGRSTGLFFLQQSMGEDVELILTPAPIHKHGGGMVMACYTKPRELEGILRKCCGAFPLWRYWGPLASPKIGRKCISYFETMTDAHDVDEAYLYLPTLDYAAQKFGPDSEQDIAAFAEFTHQLERIMALCEKRGCSLTVTGDYEIAPVTAEPVRPNVTLRSKGLFAVRRVGGMTYPDFHQSRAFAVCDHEICFLVGEEREKAKELLLATGDYEEAGAEQFAAGKSLQSSQSVFSRAEIEREENNTASPQLQTANCKLQTANSPIVLLAKQGSWCEYKWWTNPKDAPDYATHVDIHNKPGFDPTELFFFGKGIVRGTHGRQRSIAFGAV